MPIPPKPDTRRWFHIVLTTYGTWLPGDPRGFRTRHHREHVEGDYKAPPAPGQYEGLLSHSRRALKSDAVSLSLDDRERVCHALVARLQQLNALVVGIAVARQHAHILAKLSPREARKIVGAAKKHAWFTLREQGRAGRLWGRSSKCTPINDRSHQLNAYRYILRHEREGAVVWRFKEGGGGEEG